MIFFAQLSHYLLRYQSEPTDWAKFALLDAHKYKNAPSRRINLARYTRNLVDDGNGKFNLMLLAWNVGQAR